MNDWNDRATLLEVQEKCILVVFTDANYGGMEAPFMGPDGSEKTANIYSQLCDYSKTISSLKCYCD